MKTENDNCLAGFKCECGSLGPFWIDVTTSMLLSDDGTEDYSGGEWEEDSPCRCVKCNKMGVVEDFQC